eukprot:4515536-Pyramimonas_sp.AAC.1
MGVLPRRFGPCSPQAATRCPARKSHSLWLTGCRNLDARRASKSAIAFGASARRCPPEARISPRAASRQCSADAASARSSAGSIGTRPKAAA